MGLNAGALGDNPFVWKIPSLSNPLHRGKSTRRSKSSLMSDDNMQSLRVDKINTEKKECDFVDLSVFPAAEVSENGTKLQKGKEKKAAGSRAFCIQCCGGDLQRQRVEVRAADGSATTRLTRGSAGRATAQ